MLGTRPREKIEFYYMTCVYLAFLSRVPGAVWGLRHGVFLVCIARMFQTREEGGLPVLGLGLGIYCPRQQEKRRSRRSYLCWDTGLGGKT